MASHDHQGPSACVPSKSTAGLSQLALARLYLQSGGYQEAEHCARMIGDADTVMSAQVSLVLGEALWRQGKHREAARIRAQIPEPVEASLQREVDLLDLQLLAESGQYTAGLERFGHLYRTPASSAVDVRIQETLAQCYARLNNLSAARLGLEWAVTEARTLGLNEGVARCLMHLALLDRVDGCWSLAETRLLTAKETFAKTGLFRSFVLASLNLGLQRLWSGRLSAAEENLADAMRLAAEMGDIRVEATARADRGLALVRLNRIADARAELARALRLCRRQASPRRLAIALEYAGELHIATRQLGPAKRVLTRALAIATNIAPDGDIIPEVLRRLAEVELVRCEYSKASDLAFDAEARALRLGDRYERATALRVQGEIWRALRSEEKASRAFQDALRILEELGETFERDRILRLTGMPQQEDLGASEIARPESSRHIARGSKSVPTSSEPRSPKELRGLLHEHGLFGSSRPLVDLMRQTALIAPIQFPVLIQGETGTGKELLARAIHAMSRAADGPFVAFNCATCPPDLLDAELFGHARGAFTGAMTARTGLVRHAKGGTLFLDEIGEMREEAQARLLRLLDSGEVRPLGSDQAMEVQVRIIAATHVDLRERIQHRRFRPDLYFRLAGIRLVLPPLRDRPGDVRELAAHFIEEARRQGHPSFAGLGEQALRTMECFDWPGNVRQLKMEIGRLAALTPSGERVEEWTPADHGEAAILPLCAADVEQALSNPDLFRRLFHEHGGHMPSIARRLGLSRGHLYRVLKRNGIDPKNLRSSTS